MHEFGHMKDDYAGTFVGRTRTEREIFAENFAIDSCDNIKGSGPLIRDNISYRALSGFLQLSPDYFMAPYLIHHFEKSSGLIMSAMHTWKTYAELRLRSAIEKIMPGALTYVPSQTIHKALELANRGEVEKIENQLLRNSCIIFDDIRNCNEHGIANPFDSLKNLGTSLLSPAISSYTEYCGLQVLQGAERFCSKAYKPEPAVRDLLTKARAGGMAHSFI